MAKCRECGEADTNNTGGNLGGTGYSSQWHRDEHIVQGNLRPKENLRLIVACVGVGADSHANDKANNAENRCTLWCQQVLDHI